MKRILTTFTIAAAAVATLACSDHGRKEVATTPVPGAKVEKISLSPVNDEYEAAGTVRSATTSMLSPKVAGTVTSILVKEGDHVRAGQLVLTIDDRDLAAQFRAADAGVSEAQDALDEVEQGIAAAEANRKLADTTYERFRTLLERKSVSQQEFDEVEAKHIGADRMLASMLAKKQQVLSKIEQAKAGRAGAAAWVGFARVTSPIDGIVTTRYVDVGSMTGPGQPLMQIENGRHYRLEANVEESMVGKIRVGDPVTVRVDASGSDLQGHVAEMVSTADPMSRSYTVKVDLPNDGAGMENLRSGMFGKALFRIGSRDAVTVPTEAVVERGQLTGVWIVDSEGLARLRLVKTGKTHGDRVEILSGLDPNDRIVTGGLAAVSDGSKVI